ncbi:uncharacterized protein V6R79_023355 [Siganus canaliculatus]
MTGRGRPRKAGSPDSKDKAKTKERKPVPVPKYPRKGAAEEQQKDTAKEQKRKEPKKTNPIAEKPSVQHKRREVTTQLFTVEPKQQQRITVKATTCAGKAKATGKSAEELNQKQLVAPKDARNDSLQTTKGKKCASYGKPMVKLTEETTKELMPKAAAEACVQTTKPKRCPGKVKVTTAKCNETVKVRAPRDGAGMNAVLRDTLSGLKIKKNERSEAAEVVNKITDDIIRYLKQNSESFKNVGEPLRTGSYYEHLKISDPDEFDVMVPISVERSVDVEPFGDDGAFYIVGLKRGINPLQKFQEGRDNLSASEMLSQFRDEVKKSIHNAKEWELTRKKKGCPAVTMTTKIHSTVISLDFVLCLMVKSSWPRFAQDGLKIEDWLGSKVKQHYKRMPYYLVPKYEGRGTVESNGVCAKGKCKVCKFQLFFHTSCMCAWTASMFRFPFLLHGIFLSVKLPCTLNVSYDTQIVGGSHSPTLRRPY